MFGSTNPFGQSSTSPFGTQSAFGQASSGNSNPFAPNPFGSTTPFGTQTGGSLFGSTATGVFGSNQASSPLPSTPVFGASSSPAFGNSVPAFGAASTSGFGNTSSSSFGGSSVFGQKPSFGGFGSSTTQTSPFGSTFQQSQPAFGSNLFGSTPFGGSSQSAFSAPSTPAFGSSSTPAFGATNTPAFGATSSPAFGSVSTPTFGSTGNAFGVSSAPGFGSSSPAFGAGSTPAFGATSAPAFGTSSSPSFGASTTPAFGASSPSFSFGSTPSFGQSTSAFGSTPFGASPSPFGAQSSAFGGQTTAPAFGSPGFGSSTFGGQRGGSRVAAYTPTAEADGATGSQPAGKLESISAMPVYKDKSHEELRWEDYQLGDKGGPNPAAQTAGAAGFGTNTQSNPFSSSSTFGQTAANPANPFSSTNATNPFGQKSAPFSTPGFAASTSTFGSSTFGNSTNANPFGSTSSPAPSLFGSTTSTFGVTPASPFGSAPATSAFGGTSTSLFGSASAQGATSTPFNSGLNFGNTQQSPLFQSNTPSIGQSSSAFGQAPSFGQTAAGFGTNMFNTPSTGFGGNMFSTTPSLLSTNSQMGFGQTMPSQSTPFQLTQPSQNAGAFGNFGQTQSAGLSGFGGTPGIFGQSNYGQSSVAQNTAVVQQAPVLNPFGTLPAMPLMSIGRAGTSPSIQYGISSLPMENSVFTTPASSPVLGEYVPGLKAPKFARLYLCEVVDKPAPARISSLLTSRHLSQRRVRLPARKYHPKNNGLKVPFFSDDEETPTTPKADTLFIPRENPRALVIRPLEQWPGRTNGEKRSLSKEHTPVLENGEDIVKNGPADEQDQVKFGQKPNGVHDEHFVQKEDAYITLTGHRAGEAAIVYEHGADIEALMPKLRHSDYYTEPRIQELAAKERAEPGFCRRVKDFVVGRHGYGNIKFLGETDVRRLDLESLVQFNHREVIVYMDESKKPPVGQGLNKPAVVTLLNVKCFDKKTGRHFTEGPRIDKYKEMLRKKAEDQGAEFVSYDPIEGEWAFKVSHFSRYELRDEDLGLDDWE